MKGCIADDGSVNNFERMSASANSKNVLLLWPHSKYAITEVRISAAFWILSFINLF